MTSSYAVVLAAGQGTRMKSTQHKVLHPICGKPMVQHIIDRLQDAGFDRKIVVVGSLAEQVREVLGDQVEYANQEQQLGTGHAVMQVAPLLKSLEGTTLVCTGDAPLISSETLKNLLENHLEKSAAVTVLTAIVQQPLGYGRIVRDQDGSVLGIVEEKDTTHEQNKIQEINSGTYIFDNQILFDALSKITNNNTQGEYYLPDCLDVIRNQGLRVEAYVTQDADEILGVNDRIQLAAIERILQDRIRRDHMKNGVTMIDPQAVYIESEVVIEPDTILLPGTHLRGKTTIGNACEIGPNTEITDSQLGNRVGVRQSVLQSAEVGSDVIIGPFAYIRPGTQLSDQVKIGDFVEVKNSKIGTGSKIPHLSYVGDADVGEHTNIGCGTITVNYDSVQKHRTVVGDRVFVGSNSNLVAPVSIGDGSFIAAGSTITESVPEDSFAIARARQVTKEGRATLLRKQLATKK